MQNHRHLVAARARVDHVWPSAVELATSLAQNLKLDALGEGQGRRYFAA